MTVTTSPVGLRSEVFASDEDATRVEWSESGRGRPVVLLHGDTTHSIPAREVRRAAGGLGRSYEIRRVAPGAEDRAAGGGLAAPHVLDDWFREIGDPDDVTLVLQSHAALDGIVWARRHVDRVRALVLVDPVIRPPSSRELLSDRIGRDELATITRNASWLSTSHVSKLLVVTAPGPTSTTSSTADWAAANVRNVTVEHLDRDARAGDDLGRQVRAWLGRISW